MKSPARSLLLETALRVLLPLMLLYSVLLLLRGHDKPGGGFVGGLVAAAAIALHALTHGADRTRIALRVRPGTLLAAGLGVALGSGLLALALGLPFQTGLWIPAAVPGLGKLGTPLLFDCGVYLSVVGTVLVILFALADEEAP